MATKTVVCPECDAPLSPGRFACPSCGALVASVATVPRSFAHAEAVLPPPIATAVMDEPAPAADAAPRGRSASRFDEPLSPQFSKAPTSIRRPATPPRSEKPGLADAVPAPPAPRLPRQQRPRQAVVSQPAALSWVVEDPEPVHGAGRAEMSQLAEPAELARIAEVAPPLPKAAPVPVPDIAPAGPPPDPASAQLSGAPAAPSWPAHPTWPPPRTIDLVEPAHEPAARVAAGAYLPPSAVLPPGEALPLPLADRREEPEEKVARPSRERSASRKVRLSLGDGTGPLGMPAEAPARIVVLGAGVSGFGFLLPWATYVIGNGKIGGYLDQWGLAGPGHLVILALIAGIALLALFAAQMPRWVRVGLPSICLSFLLTGLVWPYLVGPYDALIGVYVVAAGAVVMIAGGLLDRIATRHAESVASV